MSFLPSENNFTAGINAESYAYQEPAINSPNVEINGSHYGIDFAYTYYHPNDLMTKLSAEFATGLVNYNGVGTFSNALDTLFNTRLLLGDEILNSANFNIIPYAGLGYRVLYNNLSVGTVNSVTDEHFPLRIIQYFYSPFGIMLISRISEKNALEWQFEYDQLWYGQVTTNAFLASPGVTLPKSINAQTQGYGLRGAFNFLIPKGRTLFSVGPFIHYWNIRTSNTITDSDGLQITEPSNSTVEVGLNASVTF